MLLNPITYGFPAGLVTIITPAMAIYSANVWHDDLNPDIATGDAMDTGGLTGDAVGQVETQVTATDSYLGGQPFLIDAPLNQTVTAESDDHSFITEADFDSFGALEMGGEFEGVVTRAFVETEDPWSIPRYSMTGQTLDCDTSAPIAAATIRQFRSSDNRFMQQTASDGAGNYAIAIFDQEDYFLTAHSGQSPAGITRRDLKGV
jgi:hypothetical protein